VSSGSSSRTIITGGAIVPDPRNGVVMKDAAVVIEGGRVRSVGPAGEISRAGDVETIDATGRLVMPGLINAHTHLYSSLARGITSEIAPSANFVEILEHLWWPLDGALTLDDVRSSAMAGALDLVRNGTTTIVDHHAGQSAVAGSLDAVADGVLSIGLRANLCYEVTDRLGSEASAAGLAENERFARRVRDGRGEAEATGGPPSLLGASVGLHAAFTVDDSTLDRAAGIAADLGVGCHLHVAEAVSDEEESLRRSGVRVVERLMKHGVLGASTLTAHCNHIDPTEMAILRETGTAVVHNPQSNMNNAVGTAPVPIFLEEGLLVGLGTDGFTPSMFDEMKVANLIHRHEAGDPAVGHDVAARLCFEGNPEIASRLFGEPIGTLAPGAPADIIVLEYDPPTPYANGNLPGHVIFGLTGWMVETVIVNGRQIMRSREFTEVDAAAVAAEARERAAALWSRV